jgi:hypothetical protein
LPFLFEFSNASTLAILASRPIWLMVIDPNSSQKQGVRQAKQLKKGPQFSARERLNLLVYHSEAITLYQGLAARAASGRAHGPLCGVLPADLISRGSNSARSKVMDPKS